METIGVKRRLWYDLLRTALGEIAYTTEGMDSPLYHDTENTFSQESLELRAAFQNLVRLKE